MMSGRRLARHVHLLVLHVHCSTHSGPVLSWGSLCSVPTSVSVQCLVCMQDLSRLGECICAQLPYHN